MKVLRCLLICMVILFQGCDKKEYSKVEDSIKLRSSEEKPFATVCDCCEDKEPIAKQELKVSSKNNYEHVMNMFISNQLEKFRHVSGVKNGLFTDLQFTYYAPSSYFTILKNHKNFIKESEWNRSFYKKECYEKELGKICYEGIIFPYIHNLTYNFKTKFVQHVVIGMSD